MDGAPVVATPEPTEEGTDSFGDLPTLAGWYVEGRYAKEDLCGAKRECPALESMRKQAEAQAVGDVPGSYHIYCENNLVYSEPKSSCVLESKGPGVPLMLQGLPTGADSQDSPGRTLGPC